jgi:hypothetical protein
MEFQSALFQKQPSEYPGILKYFFCYKTELMMRLPLLPRRCGLRWP